MWYLARAPAKDGSRTITNSTDAAFVKYTGIYTPTNSVSPGGCIVNDLTPVPIGNITGLDVKGRDRPEGNNTISATCIATTFVLLEKPAPAKPGARGAVPPAKGN